MIKDPNTGLVTSTSCPHPLRQFLRPTIIEFDAFEPMNRSFKLTFGPSLTVYVLLRFEPQGANLSSLFPSMILTTHIYIPFFN